MITASLKNYRISPRKVRVVANMIRGKSAVEARNILLYADKKAKGPLNDLLASAVANAKNNFKIEVDTLFVKEIRVDQGFVMKRQMPVSRGSAHPIKKRTSHVSITLAPKVEVEKKAKVKKVFSVKKTIKK
ncbi:MAG: 50S ribosomal protein L22 [Candidatus Paceibacterota bacterium]|jgi:large subunit ribosomal protein L22